MNLEVNIQDRISRIEKDIEVYNSFLKSSAPEDHKKIVAFKLFHELVAYSTLAELVGYAPSAEKELQLAAAFKVAVAYVSIDGDRKVVISQEYFDLLKMQTEFMQKMGGGKHG